MKIRLFMQSQSDDRKLASDDSHWSASAQNFVLKGQWKTEFSRRPFRTGSDFIWSARTSPRFGTGRHVAALQIKTLLQDAIVWRAVPATS